MSRIAGIDLGTTNSLVATVDAGIPYVIAGRSGKRLLPSVVHFAADGTVLVGEAANRVRAADPSRSFYSVKRFIGRRASELADEELTVNYKLGRLDDGRVALETPERTLAPEDISAEVLKELKQAASDALGEEISRAVITVPAYFNDAQRNATKRAAEIAGLAVERIINEPTAAALAYGLDKLGERSKIAVYDFGGGTFDLSILELTEGVFQVLATNGNTRLGGDDIDAAVVEFLARQIEAAGGPDCRREAGLMARLRDAAEVAKIKLSSEVETQILLPFLRPDFSFEMLLTRSALEKIAEPIVRRTRAHCVRSLADAKLEARQLDQVILVGGQTRMPLVREVVKEIFGCVEFEPVAGTLRIGSEYHKPEGPMLNTSQNADEAVALGAAIQAEILSGGFKNMLLLDVTPLSLGIETFGGLMNVIIPRNSTIPVKAGEMFTTAMDNQPSMLIHVLQGERERARDNWSLGKFTIEFERAPRGIPRVGVQFEIDANGILHVLARDTRTGREKMVEMKSAVDVADEDVQRMVEESVEHAFDDLRARQWTEAKLRAIETAAATRKGLAECGSEINPEAVAEIEACLRVLDSVLASEDPVTQSGDARKLKASIAELDNVTRPLAEHMLDKAMEAMLRQRGLLQ